MNYSRSEWEEDGACREKMKELLFERQAYYQVLIDRRDFHQVVRERETNERGGFCL